ncbi:MAG: hypothetical protein R2854_30950 [Caldilineaceae bacterium]
MRQRSSSSTARLSRGRPHPLAAHLQREGGFGEQMRRVGDSASDLLMTAFQPAPGARPGQGDRHAQGPRPPLPAAGQRGGAPWSSS